MDSISLRTIYKLLSQNKTVDMTVEEMAENLNLLTPKKKELFISILKVSPQFPQFRTICLQSATGISFDLNNVPSTFLPMICAFVHQNIKNS